MYNLFFVQTFLQTLKIQHSISYLKFPTLKYVSFTFYIWTKYLIVDIFSVYVYAGFANRC